VRQRCGRKKRPSPREWQSSFLLAGRHVTGSSPYQVLIKIVFVPATAKYNEDIFELISFDAVLGGERRVTVNELVERDHLPVRDGPQASRDSHAIRQLLTCGYIKVIGVVLTPDDRLRESEVATIGYMRDNVCDRTRLSSGQESCSTGRRKHNPIHLDVRGA
jgi:hypothetical protein